MEADAFAPEAFVPDPSHEAVHGGLWVYDRGRCSQCGSVSVPTLHRLVEEFSAAHLAEADPAEIRALVGALGHLITQISERS